MIIVVVMIKDIYDNDEDGDYDNDNDEAGDYNDEDEDGED